MRSLLPVRLSSGIHPFDEIPAVSVCCKLRVWHQEDIQLKEHPLFILYNTSKNKRTHECVLFAQDVIKALKCACKHDLLISRCTNYLHIHADTWLSMWVWQHRGREMQMLCVCSFCDSTCPSLRGKILGGGGMTVSGEHVADKLHSIYSCFSLLTASVSDFQDANVLEDGKLWHILSLFLHCTFTLISFSPTRCFLPLDAVASLVRGKCALTRHWKGDGMCDTKWQMLVFIILVKINSWFNKTNLCLYNGVQSDIV